MIVKLKYGICIVIKVEDEININFFVIERCKMFCFFVER